MSVMTIVTPDRRTAPEASTEAHEPVGILGHSARRGSLSFESPAPGRYLAIEDADEVVLLPLAADLVHIGRSPAADIVLDDASVSRRHALVTRRGERTLILDDRSRNGVHVNGTRVGEAELRDGDTIIVGRVTLRFVER
jgi:pSer/pThr/pTyr-binding forkhead associated (FHA) protein